MVENTEEVRDEISKLVFCLTMCVKEHGPVRREDLLDGMRQGWPEMSLSDLNEIAIFAARTDLIKLEENGTFSYIGG